MRRTVLFLISLLLICSLCGCGKAETAKECNQDCRYHFPSLDWGMSIAQVSKYYDISETEESVKSNVHKAQYIGTGKIYGKKAKVLFEFLTVGSHSYLTRGTADIYGLTQEQILTYRTDIIESKLHTDTVVPEQPTEAQQQNFENNLSLFHDYMAFPFSDVMIDSYGMFDENKEHIYRFYMDASGWVMENIPMEIGFGDGSKTKEPLYALPEVAWGASIEEVEAAYGDLSLSDCYEFESYTLERYQGSGTFLEHQVNFGVQFIIVNGQSYLTKYTASNASIKDVTDQERLSFMHTLEKVIEPIAAYPYAGQTLGICSCEQPYLYRTPHTLDLTEAQYALAKSNCEILKQELPHYIPLLEISNSSISVSLDAFYWVLSHYTL